LVLGVGVESTLSLIFLLDNINSLDREIFKRIENRSSSGYNYEISCISTITIVFSFDIMVYTYPIIVIDY